MSHTKERKWAAACLRAPLENGSANGGACGLGLYRLEIEGAGGGCEILAPSFALPDRIADALNACVNLPEPEKNIRELVTAASGVLIKRDLGIDIRFDIEELREALKPLKEKDNADTKTATP